MMATASMGIMRTVIAKPLRSFVPIGSPVSRLLSCRKEAPATLGRGQVARLFRPSCLGTNGRGVRRALQVSLCRFRPERCTTARCRECDAKQEILRSSEFSTRHAGTNRDRDNTSSRGNGPRVMTLNSWWHAHRPGARCQPLGAFVNAA
jgi:hypothetical protein